MSTQSYKCKGKNHNTDCPLKSDCYRFTREPDRDQKYYKNIPYDENNGRCNFYLPHWVMDELKQKK